MRKLWAFAFFVFIALFHINLVHALPFPPSQLPPQQIVHGAQAQESLGTAIASLGDINGDQVTDYAVGSPLYSNAGGVSRGKVEVRDVNSSVLFTFLGNAAGDAFGSALAAIGDVDGDQVNDLLIGAAGGDYVQVRSGANGNLIRQTNSPVGSGSFGWAVAEIGDIDQDNVPDYVVTEPYAVFGMVWVYSGATGAQVAGSPFQGSSTLPAIGHSVSKLGDINNDGRPDFLLGTPYTSTGNVVVVSGLSLTVLRTHAGTPSPHFSYDFGNSVAGLGDISGDGIVDYAITEHGTSSVFVYSGANGLLLHLFGPELSQTIPGVFGYVVASAGDVDRDGVGDILITQGVYQNSPFPSSGAVYVFSGRTFGILDLFVVGPTCQFELIGALASLGDINSDGYPDIAFGSPSATNGTLGGAGRLYIQRLVGAKTYGDNINRGLTLEFFPGPVGLNSMDWGYLKISGGTPLNYFIIGAATQPTPLSPHDPVLIDLFNNPAIPGIPYGIGIFDANGDYYVHLLPFYQVNWMFERQTMYIQVAEFLPSPLGYTTSKGLMFTPPWL